MDGQGGDTGTHTSDSIIEIVADETLVVKASIDTSGSSPRIVINTARKESGDDTSGDDTTGGDTTGGDTTSGEQ